jgi:phage baseplate assembly protein W
MVRLVPLSNVIDAQDAAEPITGWLLAAEIVTTLDDVGTKPQLQLLVVFQSVLVVPVQVILLFVVKGAVLTLVTVLEQDEDVNAIRNSIKNIFTTKKGQKIYDPLFGSSLDQHLFEKVDDFYAKLIGKQILNNIETYEPRIEILKIFVLPIPDQNEYNITIYYTFLKLKKEQTLKLKYNDKEIIEESEVVSKIETEHGKMSLMLRRDENGIYHKGEDIEQNGLYVSPINNFLFIYIASAGVSNPPAVIIP